METNNFIYTIPSYNRVNKQITVNYLHEIGIKKDRIYVFVQTKEDEALYTEKIGDKANIVFKEAKRGIEARNNILNTLVEENNIVMLDDDIEAFTNVITKEPYNLKVIINPLGEWTGGTDVDTGATNRKLGSDMAQSVTGGGLHGKDLSKADVSVNIYAFLKAQETGKTIELCCAIGDTEIDGKPYKEIVEEAREYINSIGGFEKFAEWGLF